MTYSQELLRSEARGKEEGLLSVALAMLKAHEPLEKIIAYSNLSTDKICHRNIANFIFTI